MTLTVLYLLHLQEQNGRRWGSQVWGTFAKLLSLVHLSNDVSHIFVFYVCIVLRIYVFYKKQGYKNDYVRNKFELITLFIVSMIIVLENGNVLVNFRFHSLADALCNPDNVPYFLFSELDVCIKNGIPKLGAESCAI